MLEFYGLCITLQRKLPGPSLETKIAIVFNYWEKLISSFLINSFCRHFRRRSPSHARQSRKPFFLLGWCNKMISRVWVAIQSPHGTQFSCVVLLKPDSQDLVLACPNWKEASWLWLWLSSLFMTSSPASPCTYRHVKHKFYEPPRGLGRGSTNPPPWWSQRIPRSFGRDWEPWGYHREQNISPRFKQHRFYRSEKVY